MNERQKAWNKWVVMAPKNILSIKDLAAVEEFLEEQQ